MDSSDTDPERQSKDHRRSLSGGKDELLERLVEWIDAKLSDDHWSMAQIKAVLAQT